MKAAYFTEKEKIEFRDEPVPALKESDALVRIAYTGICGSDVHTYRGTSSASFPIITGHEFSGVIEEIPKNAVNPAGLKKGDKVVGWIV
ncbi:MAG: alcohol dehydrogenase catalytic domain-containing protein, partial [Spirochaetales bacterium]|nr:alcohol dehydrogenase catalytic domain-containing protein [Spirochaetales bacterium]